MHFVLSFYGEFVISSSRNVIAATWCERVRLWKNEENETQRHTGRREEKTAEKEKISEAGKGSLRRANGEGKEREEDGHGARAA